MSIIQHDEPAGKPDRQADLPTTDGRATFVCEDCAFRIIDGGEDSAEFDIAVASHLARHDFDEVLAPATDRLAPALADLVERSEQTTLVQHDQPAPGASQTPPPWSTIGIAIATGDWRGGEVTMPVSADPEYLWWESPDILIPFEFPGNNALSTDEGVYLPHYRTYAIQGAYAGPGSTRIIIEHIRPRTTGDQRPTTTCASGRPATMRRLGEALIALARAVEGGDDW